MPFNKIWVGFIRWLVSIVLSWQEAFLSLNSKWQTQFPIYLCRVWSFPNYESSVNLTNTISGAEVSIAPTPPPAELYHVPSCGGSRIMTIQSLFIFTNHETISDRLYFFILISKSNLLKSFMWPQAKHWIDNWIVDCFKYEWLYGSTINCFEICIIYQIIVKHRWLIPYH